MSTRPVASARGGQLPPCQRGSITAVALCWLVLLVGLSGLIIDGGRVVATHVRAADRAAAAGRMGAQQLANIRGGSPNIDCAAAVTVVRSEMARAGYTRASVGCTATTIRVSVTVRVPVRGLRFFGVGDRQVHVTREVRTVQQ